MSIEGQGHFFTIYFPGFVLIRPRYQVSVYRTIGPLVGTSSTYCANFIKLYKQIVTIVVCQSSLLPNSIFTHFCNFVYPPLSRVTSKAPRRSSKHTCIHVSYHRPTFKHSAIQSRIHEILCVKMEFGLT